MGPLLFVIRAEANKGQGIRVRLLGLDSHYCHDDEQQIPAQCGTDQALMSNAGTTAQAEQL